MSQPSSRTLLPLFAVFLVCALASAAIWMGAGILNTRAGGDSPFLLIRTHEMAANVRAGVFPARWMPNAAYGLGYPFFNFYAALPYYMAALLNVAGVDLIIAIQLTQTLGMFAAGFAMWLFAQRYLPAWGSALAACAYVLAPFHLVNVYVRGDSLSEFWAFVWFPLILWAATKTIDDGRRAIGAQMVLALSLAGLVLTHNVSAVLFAPFIVIYALALLIWRARSATLARPHPEPPSGGGKPLPNGERSSGSPPSGRGWGRGNAAHTFLRGTIALSWPALLALALSAWFWLPALGESSTVQLGEQTSGYFNYANHFRAGNLVQRSLVFDYTTNENGDAFAMGLVQAALVVLGSAVWLFAERKTKNVGTQSAERRASNSALRTPHSELSAQHSALRTQRSALRTQHSALRTQHSALSTPHSALRTSSRLFSPVLFLSLFTLSTFMLLPASTFIWENAPLLKLAQFPWRMLSVQAVFASVLIGGIWKWEIGDRRLEIRATISNLQSPISFLFSLIALLLLIWSALAQLPNARLNVQSRDVSPASIQLYEWFTGNIGSTIRAEYLPKTALPVPRAGPALLGLPPQAFTAQDGVSPAAISSQLQSQSPARQVWRVQAAQPMRIAVPLIYTPAWQARLDDAPVALAPHAGSGWASLDVPAGEHTLTLTHAGTPVQHAGNAISLVALLVLSGLAVFLVVRASMNQRRFAAAFAGSAVAVLIVLWCIGLLLHPPQTAPVLQTLDFNTRPFPHRDPTVFANKSAQYQLIGASIAPAQLRAGDAFTLALQWKADRAPAAITVTQELPSGGEFMSLFRHARSQVAGDPRISPQVALAEALRGVLLIKVQASDANGNLLDVFNPDGTPILTTLAGKQVPAITLIGPTILDTPQTGAKITAMFSNGIALHGIDWFYANSQEVCFRPQWSLQRDDANQADALQVSLRLRGNDGRMIAQADSQPQGGLAPTWSWQKGVLVHDSQCVPAQGMLEAGEPYTLQIVWYRAADLQPVSETALHGARGPVMEDLNVPAP